ncbi:MAG: DUF3298 domain-containing protein [Bacteroidota bacterium]
MKTYLGITLLMCWFAVNIQAQSLLPPSCYMRLEGFKDQQSKIILHLVKVNDSLYGDYNAGELSGKINAKGKFWLKSWPGETEVDIKGQFKDNKHLSITWENTATKEKKLSFELAEKYPEGSIPFKVYFETAVRKIAPDPKSPQASVKLSLLVPEITENHLPGIDSLSRILIKSFSQPSGDQGNQESAETMLAAVKKDFLDNYISSNEAMYKEMPGESFGWELLKYIHIIYNDDFKLTFYLVNYEFTGGAHGLETQVFSSVDMKTGKQLTLNDLFKSGYESKLTILLTGKLHQMLKLPASGKLTESGYFVDEIKPNDNFYVKGQGIGFLYNHYEIAPYSFGATDIFLTREELKGLLK